MNLEKKVNQQICVQIRECIYCYKVLSLTAKYINIKYKINSGKNMVSINEKL